MQNDSILFDVTAIDSSVISNKVINIIHHNIRNLGKNENV